MPRLASQVLHIDHVAAIGACRGITIMAALKQHLTGEVIAWCCGRGMPIACHNVRYRAKTSHGSFLPSHYHKSLRRYISWKARWEEVCSIKYLFMSAAQVKGVVAVAPNIPLLVSARARYRRVTAEGPVDDEAPTSSGNNIDIDAWPPPRQSIDCSQNLVHLSQSTRTNKYGIQTSKEYPWALRGLVLDVPSLIDQQA